jgi:hypothetical protein
MEDMPRTPAGAFFVHWFHFLCFAAEARDKAGEIQAANPDAWPAREALSAILFSALATEAFINELAEAAARDSAEPYSAVPGVSVLADLAVTLSTIEEAQGQIGLKYHMARKILTGAMFDPSRAPFQAFGSLIKLRNDLVHPKHLDRTRPSDRTRPGGYIEPQSSVVRDLQQQGLTNTKGRKPGDPAGGTSWLNEISCSRTATWAHKAARDIIAELLGALPDDCRLSLMAMFRQRLSQM